MAEKIKKIQFLPVVMIILAAVLIFAGGKFAGQANVSSKAKHGAGMDSSVAVQNIVLPDYINSTRTARSLEVLLKAANSKIGIAELTLVEAKNLFDSGKAVFVDARGVNEYKESHIKGALSIPLNDADSIILSLKNAFVGKLVVTYCHGAQCSLSYKVAQKLYDAGVTKVAVFFGGWPQWKKNNLPVEGISVAKITENPNREDTAICPVSGKSILKAEASTVLNYNEIKYYFCCDACIGPFKADPEKYIN